MSIIRLEEPRVMPKTPPPKGFALFAFGFRPFISSVRCWRRSACRYGSPFWPAASRCNPYFRQCSGTGTKCFSVSVAAIIVGFLPDRRTQPDRLVDTDGTGGLGRSFWLAGRLAMFFGQPGAGCRARSCLSASRGRGRGPVEPAPGAGATILSPCCLPRCRRQRGGTCRCGWLADIAPTTGLHAAVALVTLLETVIAGRIAAEFSRPVHCGPYRGGIRY